MQKEDTGYTGVVQQPIAVIYDRALFNVTPNYQTHHLN